MGIRFNNSPTNVLIDTGASCSIIDIGSVYRLGLRDRIIPNSDQLINASGHTIDIMGSVNISLDMPDAAILHNFRVLNSKTYRNVLLGRDFLAKFDRIESILQKIECE